MRCNTPPRPPRPPPEKKPKVFTHIYLHDTVPCKRHRRVQQESGFAGTAAAAAWLSWFNLQLAGRVSLTGKSSVVFFVFFLSPSCLKQVKAGPLPWFFLPVLLFTSPTWQISISPLQLAFLLLSRAHTSLCYCSDEAAQGAH